MRSCLIPDDNVETEYDGAEDLSLTFIKVVSSFREFITRIKPLKQLLFST